MEQRKGEIKEFIDPLYYEKERQSIVNYASLRGKWEMESREDENTVDRKYLLVLKPRDSKEDNSIELAFKTWKSREEFVSSLYTTEPIKEIGNGVKFGQPSGGKVLAEAAGIIVVSKLFYSWRKKKCQRKQKKH